MTAIKERIKSNSRIKKLAHYLLIPKNQARPRKWVKLFVNPFVHQIGKGAVIRRRTRMDVLPFNVFSLGNHSTIEDFSTINNGVGDVRIGNNSRVGIGNVLIGPVAIGNDVILAQNVVLSGLNHTYSDISIPIHRQAVTTSPIHIGDECWIGANAVITAGVSLGKHCVVAAGSVVTRNMPDYCIIAGNPGRVIKKYDAAREEWMKV